MYSLVLTDRSAGGQLLSSHYAVGVHHSPGPATPPEFYDARQQISYIDDSNKASEWTSAN